MRNSKRKQRNVRVYDNDVLERLDREQERLQSAFSAAVAAYVEALRPEEEDTPSAPKEKESP